MKRWGRGVGIVGKKVGVGGFIQVKKRGQGGGSKFVKVGVTQKVGGGVQVQILFIMLGIIE